MSVWIGAPREDKKIETVYFRLEFDSKDVTGTVIKISGTGRYRLYINGNPLHSGPVRGDRWSHYYSEVDLKDYIKQGKNVMAAKVMSFIPPERSDKDHGTPMWGIPSWVGPCLFVSGDNCFATGDADWAVCSDTAVKWQMHPMSAWIGSMEIVDGSKVPENWNSVGPTGGKWINPRLLWAVEPHPYGEIPPLPLKPSPIPLMYEKRREVSGEAQYIIPAGNKITLEFDAGELTTGFFCLGTKGGKGSEIKILYAECYYTGGVKADRESGVLEGYFDIYRPSGGDDLYEPFLFRTFRFVRIEAVAGDEDIILTKPYYYETGYPLEIKSDVCSSEQWVKQLWNISVNTLKRCMHETYEDCPYYEQLQYTMDTRLEMLFTYMASADTKMAKRTIFDYHSSLLPEGILQSRYPCCNHQVIPAFALHWIFMLEDYYIQTGDISLLRRYRPTADAVLDWFDRKIGSFGLIEHLGYWDFCDWAEGWKDGVPPASAVGPVTSHNLVYAYALQCAARIFAITGRRDTAEEMEQRGKVILANVEKHCWSEADGLYKEGPQCNEFSQHTQIWAVLCGLAEGGKAKDLMNKCRTRTDMYKCTFPQMFYYFRALEQADMYGDTAQLWEMWKDFLPLNVTTWPETPVNPRSDCHAWGSLPLYEFTRNILGINPLSPGWKTVKIQPRCAGLPDAKGVVATPVGDIAVEWDNTDGFKIKCSVPQGIYTELVLPDGTVKKYHNGGGIYEYIGNKRP